MKTVRCCVVGGGPAGVMLGYLLARAGVEVCVLEKHADFFRDFRGDTVHPSTMTVLDELGILDRFLKVPHSEVTRLGGRLGKDDVWIADFSHIPAKTKFIALMPQWDFLNFLADQGRAYATFTLLMNTEARDVIRERGRVVGVRAMSAQGPTEIRADLVVAADGRSSTIRNAYGFSPVDLGAPMDVLWFRISRQPTDTSAAFGFIGAGYVLVTINRNDYWQCGLVIAKGMADAVKAEGLDALRQKVVAVAPIFTDRVRELTNWDGDIRVLSVAVNRLERWFGSGILFVGDAAHAMSPIGGVGINLAIQDAIASARILAPYFKRPGPIDGEALARVQRRREWPARMTQTLQVFIQKNVVTTLLAARKAPERAPLLLRILSRLPLAQTIPALLVGIGFRPEHLDR